MTRKTMLALGARLRDLREARKDALRVVAAAAGIDPAVLSKVERGDRLPTSQQVSSLARYFCVAEVDLQAARIAVEFIERHGSNPALPQALDLIRDWVVAGGSAGRRHGIER